jgi:hypothetical protein
VPTSGIMTSGNGFFPSLRNSQAASKMAWACISVISGYSRPRRQPRKPSMGLNSCKLSVLALIRRWMPLFCEGPACPPRSWAGTHAAAGPGCG